MTAARTRTIVFALLTTAIPAAAQQPARPGEASRAVTLSLAEYNRLIDLANRPATGTAVPPVPVVLASAEMRVRVDRDSARGVFTINGDALVNGLSRVSVLPGGTIIEASIGGRPLPLVSEGNVHTAIVPGPGAFSLNVEWGAPLTYAPGRASFVLPVPQSGSARATIDLPGEQAEVHLSAGQITGRSVNDGRTIVEATLDPGSSTEVWWSMRESVQPAALREVRTLADVMTLVTLGDSDVRLATLIDLTVLQGALRTIAVRLPSGYELTGVSGSSLEASEPRDGSVVLTIGDPAARSHQFLITLERPHAGGSFTFESGLVAIPDVQRERGEVAIEGIGTLELTAADRDGMHRIDVRELNEALQSLARQPILSAFRYQRTSSATPGLTLDVRRFADAGVLAAVADNAEVTTLITSEGRALTEVVLNVQNRAQPFLKVTLPAGASIVSVEVAGVAAKPVTAADGSRVPLLRPGFRPTGSYSVSFVYLHPGAPLGRKGDVEMLLPKMDIPIGLIQWQVFVPQQYSVRAVDGNAFDSRTVQRGMDYAWRTRRHTFAYRGELEPASAPRGHIRVALAQVGLRGEIRGRATDISGAVLPGVTIELRSLSGVRSATTGADGTFVVSGLPGGRMTIAASLAGFRSETATFQFTDRPMYVEVSLSVGMLTETITVSAESPSEDELIEPTSNVLDLQRRVAGVLPIRVDVPRTGRSHYFVKPLVVDEETFVRLRYARR